MSNHLSEAAGERITVFNYAIYGMRIEQMYYFLQDILKTHTPNLIILETYAFCPLADEHREILARRAFDVLPLSMNKVHGINYCVLEDYWSYYIPFIKYHTRWKELSKSNFTICSDEGSWSEEGTGGPFIFDVPTSWICEDPKDGYFLQNISQLNDECELTKSEKECLHNMIELLDKKDIPLLLVSVPYKQQLGLNSVEQVKINNYIENNYVNNTSIKILDMNRMWKELGINYSDLFNEGRLNSFGAPKATNCLLEYLTTNYDLPTLLS